MSARFSILPLLFAFSVAACSDDSGSGGGSGGSGAGEGGETATGGTGLGGETGNSGGSSSGGAGSGGSDATGGAESTGGSSATGGTGGGEQTLVWADVSDHFATDCASCHGKWATTYAGVKSKITGNALGLEDRINLDPSNAASMPKNGGAWAHRDEVSAWIEAGAPEN